MGMTAFTAILLALALIIAGFAAYAVAITAHVWRSNWRPEDDYPISRHEGRMVPWSEGSRCNAAEWTKALNADLEDFNE